MNNEVGGTSVASREAVTKGEKARTNAELGSNAALVFEHQVDESNKAFAAFSFYLSLGPERSTREVSRKLHKSVTMLGRWSSKFDWPARVAAHGAHLAIVEREAIEAAARSKA